MMTAQDLWSKISDHQLEGVMLHFQLADLFNFLSLPNLSAHQEEHYQIENKALRETHCYASKHHGVLLRESRQEAPELIPATWYKHTKADVDKSTRKSHLMNAYEHWYKWEVETLKFYSRMYKEAMDACLVADACQVKTLLQKVSRELSELECSYTKLKLCDFDMSMVLSL